MFKRILTFALVAIMLLAISGCSKPEVEPSPSPSAIATPSPTPDATSEPTPEPTPDVSNLSTTTGKYFDGVYNPVAVMFDNSSAARPHTGLQSADVVYESYVEGSITRICGVFSDTIPEVVGPVRSCRWPFAEIAAEWDSIIIHAGGPQNKSIADIYQKFKDIGVSKNVDAIYGNYTSLFYRDKTRKSPHNLYINPQKVQSEAAFAAGPSRQHTALFSNEPKSGGNEASYIDVPWITKECKVNYTYDAEKAMYMRAYGSTPHKDKATDSQIGVKNVIIQYVQSYTLTGQYVTCKLVESGNAQIFIDGLEFDATWKRDNMDAQTHYYDANGAEFVFAEGNTWIELFPDNAKNMPSYK